MRFDVEGVPEHLHALRRPAAQHRVRTLLEQREDGASHDRRHQHEVTQARALASRPCPGCDEDRENAQCDMEDVETRHRVVCVGNRHQHGGREYRTACRTGCRIAGRIAGRSAGRSADIRRSPILPHAAHCENQDCAASEPCQCKQRLAQRTGGVLPGRRLQQRLEPGQRQRQVGRPRLEQHPDRIDERRGESGCEQMTGDHRGITDDPAGDECHQHAARRKHTHLPIAQAQCEGHRDRSVQRVVDADGRNHPETNAQPCTGARTDAPQRPGQPSDHQHHGEAVCDLEVRHHPDGKRRHREQDPPCGSRLHAHQHGSHGEGDRSQDGIARAHRQDAVVVEQPHPPGRPEVAAHVVRLEVAQGQFTDQHTLRAVPEEALVLEVQPVMADEPECGQRQRQGDRDRPREDCRTRHRRTRQHPGSAGSAAHRDPAAATTVPSTISATPATLYRFSCSSSSHTLMASTSTKFRLVKG